MSDPAALAADVHAAVAALRRGDPDVARALLAEWVEDPDLAAAADLVDVRARLWSLYAQSLVALDRVEDALAAARRARALAGEDPVAAAQIGEVIAAARARSGAIEADRRARAEAERLVATSTEALLAGLVDPEQRAEARLARASALLGVGRRDEARALYEENLRGFASTKTAVLSRIGLAHCAPDEAQLRLAEAWDLAAQEPALYAATTHAAVELGVPAPTAMGGIGLVYTSGSA